jgi:sulfotransferase family protein
MALRVVGAGLARTGTMSLRHALQTLLGGACYHMSEVFPRPDHVTAWHQACLGKLPDWEGLFAGFDATVDWPASGFWRELSAAYPDALVVLSRRESPDVWWQSASRTVLHWTEQEAPPGEEAAWAMCLDFLRARFTDRWLDPEAAMAAYIRHNDAVRAETPPERLLEWLPGDGWPPLCAALGLPVPDEPFPCLNTSTEFRARAGWDA